MDKCHNCGSIFTKATAKFCSKCGTKKKMAGSASSSGVNSARGNSTPATQAEPTQKESPSLPSCGPPDSARATATFKLSPRKGPLSADPKIKGPTSTVPAENSSANSNSASGSRGPDISPRSLPPLPGGKDSLKDGTPTHSEGKATKKKVSLGSTSDFSKHTSHKIAPKPQGGDSSSAEKTGSSDREATQDGYPDMFETINVSPEEEEQYNTLATLGPDGITPEMLQTSNVSELKQWRRGSLVGKGTYGSVYMGLLPDGSFHAVKCVELGGKAGILEVKELVSLSREINLMQRMRHKNLCKFKGVYYDGTSICMFMEFLGGGSLSNLVKKLKPLPADVVRRWTRQLLSGLLYLHSQHIIHRDIKGDNVLVDTSSDPSEEAQIKLVDFGAARRLSDAVSRSRTVIGTPYWMAPEVVDVTGEDTGYSYKADVWSVGCTVAEMLTGKPPWPSKANAPMAIMMIAQAEGGPTEIPEKEATPGCLNFMKQCFERNPENRPTVEELLNHPWIKGEME